MERATTTAIFYLLAALADLFLLIWASRPPMNEPSNTESAFCFVAAVLFMLAASLASRRKHLAHLCAVAGAVALPWLYTTTLHGNIYANLWIIFNVPDRDLRMYNSQAGVKSAILGVALIVFAIAIGVLRLLPRHWVLRKMPLRERTWPAVAATFCFLAIWFSQSVMPYRIPGALDYSSWPMLQILHIQKHGLQFHETCVKVWGRRGVPESVSVSTKVGPRGSPHLARPTHCCCDSGGKVSETEPAGDKTTPEVGYRRLVPFR